MSDETPTNDEPTREPVPDFHAPRDMSRGESIFFFGFIAAAAATMGAIVVSAIKQERREEEAYQLAQQQKREAKQALETWVNDEQNAGNNIYKLDDGRFLAVDRQAPQTTHLPREIVETIQNRNVV